MASTIRSQLIKLQDGTLVEIDTPPGFSSLDTSSRFAEVVDSDFDNIKPLLTRVYWSFTRALEQIHPDHRRAEIEFGLKFSAEGDVFLANSKNEAAITVKLTL